MRGLKEMRRIVLQLSKEFVIKWGYKEIFNYIEKMELLRMYRFDKYNMIAMQVFKFSNPNYRPENMIGIDGIQILDVLKENPAENEYHCLVKSHNSNGFTEILDNFDFILDFPIILNQKGAIVPMIAPPQHLKKILNQASKIVGKGFKILEISTIKPNLDFLYSLLTKKQIEIMNYAASKGYFEIPRKITSKEIAEKFNISTSALNEHLRKVERKINNFLFKKPPETFPRSEYKYNR